FSLRPRAAVPSDPGAGLSWIASRSRIRGGGGEGGGGGGGGGEGRSEEECEHRVLAEVAACQKVKTINLLQIASASVPALAKRHFQESVLLRGPWSSMKRWPKNF
ncbi:unnamed protein product, partial [Prorocentrum cordatum]